MSLKSEIRIYKSERSNKFRFSVYGPQMVFRSLNDNFELVISLAKKEIKNRFRGSVLGIFWSFLLPVVTLFIYTFVFTVIFKARWSVETPNQFDFALNLFTGLIAFNLFAETISRAPGLLIENTVYIKKIVFPLEIICWVPIVSSLFNATIAILIVFVAYTLMFSPAFAFLLVPVVLIPFIFFLIGTSWFLAPLGLFFPDLRQAISPILTIFMFSSPVFYPSSALPDKFRTLVDLSPLSITINNLRGCMSTSESTQTPLAFMLFTLIMLVYAWLAFMFFTYLKRGYADVV